MVLPEGHGGSARFMTGANGECLLCAGHWLKDFSHLQWVELCPSKQCICVLAPRICERGLIWKECLQV